MTTAVATDDLSRFDLASGALVANADGVKEAHALTTPWSFWHVKRAQGPRTQENYERNIKRIGSFDTVRLSTRCGAAGGSGLPAAACWQIATTLCRHAARPCDAANLLFACLRVCACECMCACE